MSNPNDCYHLNGRQMSQLLEAAEPAASEHLQGCTTCQEELRSLEASLGGFRAAMTGYAGAVPALAARPIVATATGWSSRLVRRSLAASFATALAVGGLMFSAWRPHPAPQTPVAAVEAAAQPQVSDSDEALLAGIDQDLSTSVPPLMEPLAPSAESRPATSAGLQ